MPNNKKLNVPAMTAHYIDNYNSHVDQFMDFLTEKLNAHLIYEGYLDVHDHICERTVYACSVAVQNRIFKDVLPIMIGSKLDLAIRHAQQIDFSNKPIDIDKSTFSEVDIGRGFFIINGYLRLLPHFYTNDPTNTHIARKKIVRVYSYDYMDRGKELTYYACEENENKPGDLRVVHNDGSTTVGCEHFFHHCPYVVNPKPYMSTLYRKDAFDIDNLANKMVVTAGHLFVKLFIKYLYGPIKEEQWGIAKSKHSLVVKSIESGCLLHVLSRKTVYYKEGKSSCKMTTTPTESYREIGDNGKIFREKAEGCYREVSMQTYPLNPYLLQIIVRQTSSKVKHSSLKAFHPSSVGFLCLLGCFDSKYVGNVSMMVRDTVVSSCDDLDPVFHDPHKAPIWCFLKIEPGDYAMVVVNEACIPVSKKCFEAIDLLRIKLHFGQVECFEWEKRYIIIRQKVGLIYKRFEQIWVTPRDQLYWAKRLQNCDTVSQLVEKYGYDYVTGYLVDLNPYFNHNAAQKCMLAFNALKNAILAYDSRFALFFMDTISAYTVPTKYHRVVLKPVNDGISPYFALMMPRLIVTYMSFQGFTQEDCIVKGSHVDAFDCWRFYTLRFKLINVDGPCTFHGVEGDADDLQFVGTLVHHGTQPFTLESFSPQVQVVNKTPMVKNIYFRSCPFVIMKYVLRRDKLSICLQQKHLSSTGDKLCSMHGQKGVLRVVDKLPLLDEKILPDLIVNVYGLFRMTPGQLLEGNGRDAKIVRNTDNEIVPGASAYYGKTFYFSVAYWSNEHLYAPRECVFDKVLGQAVRGRSRGGGMRLGNMELLNGLRGNGIASCFEEKFFEHSDRFSKPLPKSVQLVEEDAKFFKCNLVHYIEPSVVSDNEADEKTNEKNEILKFE